MIINHLLTLRTNNDGASYYITIPLDTVRAFKLKPGDKVLISIDTKKVIKNTRQKENIEGL